MGQSGSSNSWARSGRRCRPTSPTNLSQSPIRCRLTADLACLQDLNLSAATEGSLESLHSHLTPTAGQPCELYPTGRIRSDSADGSAGAGELSPTCNLGVRQN